MGVGGDAIAAGDNQVSRHFSTLFNLHEINIQNVKGIKKMCLESSCG